MKLFVKLLITALVLAVLLPFTLLKGGDGKPLMTLDKLKLPSMSMPKVPDNIKIPDLPAGDREKDIIYKWRDARGDLHFTSSPPADGIKFTTKGYDPNTNLIQSVEVKEEEPVEIEVEQPKDAKPTDNGNPYSPEKIGKLIDDAQNVQKLLNERMKQQDALMGQ